jgi:ABC-type multidrug transport system fused ATPase/permease subunit
MSSLDGIRRNLLQEKKLIQEIRNLQSSYQTSDISERGFYSSTIVSLKNQLKILNDSLVPMINAITFAKELPSATPKELVPLKFQKEMEKKPSKESTSQVDLRYVSPSTKENVLVSIDKKEKERFAKELQLSETNLEKLKETARSKVSDKRKWENLARISNKVYGKLGEGLAPVFKDLKNDLSGANILFFLPTYLSMALFVTTLNFLFSIIIFVFAIVFVEGSALWAGWIFLLPVFSFMMFYFGPSLQKTTVEKNVSSELPFATIYMGAIAGSNVEPIRIFKIIAATPEYPFFGMEIRKVINQVEVYGVDLVNALKNVAAKATNRKFAELLGGMATNILSGGSLKNYLDKKSENYLMDYRLEMQKYSAVAGTFMDIYISVLITAPLVLMMVFVVVQLSGVGSLSATVLFPVIIGGIAIANIIFLFMLHLKQPK